MADVVFLGLGPTTFDNKSIDRVIGQEVPTGQAEVELLGKKGPIVPRAREPQVRFNGVEAPEAEVQLEGINEFTIPSAREPQVTFGNVPQPRAEVQLEGIDEFSVPPPTQNPEVAFVETPTATGQVVGPVFNVSTPDAVLGPIGQSNAILDLPSVFGEFLYPVSTFTDTDFDNAPPMAPLSIAPQTSAPIVGTAFASPPFSAGSLSFPAGTLAQLNASFPNQFPAVDGPVKGMRITFLNIPTVNPLLRGVSSDLTNASYGDPLDTIGLDTFLPATPGMTDQFLIQGQELARNTPVLEVILG